MGDRSFQAGKGSADRSPDWRKHYDEVCWPDGGRRLEGNGFVRQGARIIKRYGTAETIKGDTAPAVVIP